jgi:chromosome segregation ATPase
LAGKLDTAEAAARAFVKARSTGAFAAPAGLSQAAAPSAPAASGVEALLAQLETQQATADWRIADLEGRLGRAAALRTASEDRLQARLEDAACRIAELEAAVADLESQLIDVRHGADAERARAAEAVRAAGESGTREAAFAEALAAVQSKLAAREPFIRSLESELSWERARANASEAALLQRLEAARAAASKSFAALSAERTAAAAAAKVAEADLDAARRRADELQAALETMQAALADASERVVTAGAQAIEARAEELEAELNAARSAIAELEASAAAAAAAAKKRIAELGVRVALAGAAASTAEEELCAARAAAAKEVSGRKA